MADETLEPRPGSSLGRKLAIGLVSLLVVLTGLYFVVSSAGFIKNYKVIADQKQGILRIYLKFIDEKDPIINEIKRVSRPGSRRYVKSDAIPSVKNGMGIAILSTSKGILPDKAAREAGVGGEILCTIW